MPQVVCTENATSVYRQQYSTEPTSSRTLLPHSMVFPRDPSRGSASLFVTFRILSTSIPDRTVYRALLLVMLLSIVAFTLVADEPGMGTKKYCQHYQYCQTSIGTTGIQTTHPSEHIARSSGVTNCKTAGASTQRYFTTIQRQNGDPERGMDIRRHKHNCLCTKRFVVKGETEKAHMQ